MKKLFLILAIVSNMAQADTWVMPNQGGGQVVLTDRLCQGYKNLYYAYTYTDRVFLDGCWRLLDGKIHIVYENGEKRVYEASDFTPDEVTPKKKGQPL
jgi:hypothetical protein